LALTLLLSGTQIVWASRIAGCPASPNCVSTRAADPDRRFAPLKLDVTPSEAWEKIKRAIAAEPRLRVVEENRADWYLRLEATSLVFRFVDDVELQIDPSSKELHLRSASRVGYWDLGVNRRRAERLREALCRQGLCQ
jgi:uncharacterized protein (DUF1499 family)